MTTVRLWNVRPTYYDGCINIEPERTTLKAEVEARRYSTDRGYLVAAANAREAGRTVVRYALNGRGFPGDVLVETRSGLPVLMAATS